MHENPKIQFFIAVLLTGETHENNPDFEHILSRNIFKQKYIFKMFCAFWVDLSTLLKQKLSKTTTENADTVCKKHCQYSHSPQSVVYVFVRFVVDVRPTTRTESAWVWVLVASCWLNCGAFFGSTSAVPPCSAVHTNTFQSAKQKHLTPPQVHQTNTHDRNKNAFKYSKNCPKKWFKTVLFEQTLNIAFWIKTRKSRFLTSFALG